MRWNWNGFIYFYLGNGSTCTTFGFACGGGLLSISFISRMFFNLRVC
jgi:hypothetical protein